MYIPSSTNLKRKIRSDCLLLRLSATISQSTFLPQVASAPVTRSPHWATIPYLPLPIRSDQKMCLIMMKISFVIF